MPPVWANRGVLASPNSVPRSPDFVLAGCWAPRHARSMTIEILHFRGELVEPADRGYDEARAVWNGVIDRRPALIARCIGAADVAAALRYARDHDLVVAVRGGGHGVAGPAVCDDGIVIDLSLMRGVRVDPASRIVHVAGGALLGDVDHETQAFGL